MKITASLRSAETSTRSILLDKKIPAVIYGPKMASTNISVDYEAFRKLIKEASMHRIAELELEGKNHEIIIRDYDLDKVKDTFIHVDFYAIEKDTAIEVLVPVKFTGESPALRLGALLTVSMAKVPVKCLPHQIPEFLEADLAKLQQVGDKIRVADLIKGDLNVISKDNVMIAKAEQTKGSKKAAN